MERGIPEAGIVVLRCNHSVSGACETVACFLQHNLVNHPTALLAMNDLSAIGAMRAALDCNLAVPQDLSIVGVDDVPLCAFLPVPLSSIRQRYRKIAATAAEMLISRIEGTLDELATPREAIFPTHFIQRQSVGTPPLLRLD
jgi:DNA-binding LacI/PurR family transcriptional regulator